MEKQLIFHILGIAETDDEEAIKSAYLTQLKATNPEDDPDGFKRLREAYESAVALARQPKQAKPQEKSKTDLWIDQVDLVYQDILRRPDPQAWKELLSDPLCEDLDTSLQTREALLAYLMDHIYLPHAIWQIIDDTFQIADDQENLLNQFPKNYLDYALYYIQNEEFIDYNLFFVTNREHYDADGYIRNYLELKRQIDQGQVQDEPSRDEWMQHYRELDAFGVYHPFQDCEFLRIYGPLLEDPAYGEDQRQEITGAILRTLDYLQPYCEESHYVGYYCGDAYWYLGRKEEAGRIWTGILAKYPTHYMAKYSLIRYQMEQGNFRQAKEYLLDLLDIDGNDDSLLEYMHTANEALITEYRSLINDPDHAGERMGNTIELAWCLFQNEQLDEVISLLESFTPDAEQEYSYENLFGRVLYRAERYEEALPHLLRWLELIRNTVDDGTDEMKKRISRRFRACHILSGCCHELDLREQALDYVEQAIAAAKNTSDRLAGMQYKAFLLFQYDKYELCIDTCDQVTELDSGYYPACLQRQEAAFMLRRGQQVVDDYYQAIDIYAGYYKPYLLAAQVFFYHNQFEDAKGVLDRAHENNVEFTPCLRLYEIKILRNLAQNREERDEALKLAEDLLLLTEQHLAEHPEDAKAHEPRKPKQPVEEAGFDIDDPSEVEFEVGLLHWDSNHFDAALKHLTRAVEQNPDRLQYRLIRGHIYLDNRKFKKALEEYAAAEEVYSDVPSLYYSRAECYENLHMMELARESLEKTLELDGTFRDACWKLSNYYKDLYMTHCDPADFKKAEEYLNRQLAIRENCYYLVERGRLYMTSFDLEQAIADFKKALTYEPRDWAACNNLGCCYKYLGEFRTAIEYLQKAVEYLGDEKNVLPYSNMADCYEAMGDYRSAIKCYEKDLKAFPHQMFLYEELGQLYSYLGEYGKSLDYLKKAPDREDYCENTALVYFLSDGGKRKAIRHYEKAISTASDKNVKANLYYSLGSFYCDYLNDLPRAVTCYRRGALLSDRESRLMDLEWRMAICLFRMGKRNDARLHAQKSMEHFAKTDCPSETLYLNYRQYRASRLSRMGWLHICLGDADKGVKLLREMTACTRCRMCRHPECFESYLFLGWYYEAIGDYREALKLYRQAEQLNPHGTDISIAAARMEKKVR